MAEEKAVSMHPRRLARKVAKAKLDRAGVTGYNKPTVVMNAGRTGPSKFSENWKKIAVRVVNREPEKKAKKKKT